MAVTKPKSSASKENLKRKYLYKQPLKKPRETLKIPPHPKCLGAPDGNALKEIKEDGIQVSVGPVTRARTRRFKEEINTLIINFQCDIKDTYIKEKI